jgi:hypothetical protein
MYLCARGHGPLGRGQAAPKSKEIKLYLRGAQGEGGSLHYHNCCEESRVFLHPSSYNFAEVHYPSPWMVYFEKVHTSKVRRSGRRAAGGGRREVGGG